MGLDRAAYNHFMSYEIGYVIDQQGNLYSRAQVEHVLAAFAEFAATFSEWFEATMAPAIEKATATFAAFAEAMRPALAEIQGIIDDVYDPLVQVPFEDQELAFRDYAGWYNARHPARKVKWSKLSRPHRRAAAWAYLAKELPAR